MPALFISSNLFVAFCFTLNVFAHSFFVTRHICHTSHPLQIAPPPHRQPRHRRSLRRRGPSPVVLMGAGGTWCRRHQLQQRRRGQKPGCRVCICHCGHCAAIQLVSHPIYVPCTQVLAGLQVSRIAFISKSSAPPFLLDFFSDAGRSCAANARVARDRGCLHLER